MRKIAIVVIAVVALTMAFAIPVLAGGGGGGINNPPGNSLYVIIEVSWDGTDDYGDWTVWGPTWSPLVGGTLLTSCTDCLDMTNYTFTFHGKTVQFDEVMVEGVSATPQAHHVVLSDKDGDGTYTGSLSASHYFPWRDAPDEIHYFDRIDYDITFDSEGNLIDFHYLQYEHKKLKNDNAKN
ncbi:hypothetical protein ACFLUH_00400 [Chloroflexota bacterium]